MGSVRVKNQVGPCCVTRVYMCFVVVRIKSDRIGQDRIRSDQIRSALYHKSDLITSGSNRLDAVRIGSDRIGSKGNTEM